MPVRLLRPEEIHDILDQAEEFYNEHYTDRGIFNRSHFRQTWEYFLTFGQGLIFIESQDGHDRATLGMVRTQDVFTGCMVYMGSFLVVAPHYRGGDVVLTLMESVHEMLESFEETAEIYLTSRVAKVEAIWLRLGYEVDAQRYRRVINHE